MSTIHEHGGARYTKLAAVEPLIIGYHVTETPFFFARGRERLFGLLHEPVGAPRGAFVFSHPFGEEKLWSHRVFVSMARALTERGYAVLRFDFAGAGDSSGGAADLDLESHLADLDAAVGVLRERRPDISSSIGLLGLRLGGAFAALYAERAGGVGPLVLWDPVLDGEAYFQELLRTNLATQLAVFGKVQENREMLLERIRSGGVANVDGYEIGRALFESCGSKTLLPGAGLKHAGPTLVIQVAPTDKAPERADLRALAQGSARGAFARVVEQAFWREIKPFYGRAMHLQQATLEWLEQTNG